MKYEIERNRKCLCRMGAAIAGLLCSALLVLVLPAMEVLAQTQCTVTASSANIRANADVGSTVLASVLKDDKLTITEEVTGADGKVWYKVIIDANSQGYVRSDLVSKDGGGQTSTNAPTATTTTTTPPASTGSSTPTLNLNVTVNMDGVEAVQPVGASVSKDQVRVRADSSTNSSVVTLVKKDVVLTVHGTKAGSGSEVWYQVSFVVDGTEVTGYIRSDFVTLNGELVPVTEEPETPPEDPGDGADVPQEPVEQPKDYETEETDGKWYLIDNVGLHMYDIAELFSISSKNAEDLEKAEKKVSRQTGIIVFLAILLVLLVLGITLLVFKIKDMMEDDGFDSEAALARRRASGSGGQSAGAGRRPVARPSGTRPAAQSGNRPQGARPTAAGNGSRPSGSRPATTGSRPVSSGSRPQGTGQTPSGAGAMTSSGSRPSGTRPVTAGSGNRPVASGSRPQGAGQTPSGTRPAPSGSRPSGTRPAARQGAEGTLERQARANVEARNLEREAAEARGRKPRNFMTDDDEFEFEFLNWDGDES